MTKQYIAVGTIHGAWECSEICVSEEDAVANLESSYIEGAVQFIRVLELTLPKVEVNKQPVKVFKINAR